MNNNKKYLIGFAIFIVLYAIVKISGSKTTYHENDSQYLNRMRSSSSYGRSSSSSTRSSSNSSSSSTRSTTTAKSTYKPYRSSSSSFNSSSSKRTVDPDDHDIESYYLDYQDEFEDEDDAWDAFEDDEDAWDDY